MKSNQYKKNKTILENFIFPLLLLGLPFLNLQIGLDLADTSYSLVNFEYFGKTDQMWFFSTFLANVSGFLMTKLPLGHTFLGMNFYTSLVLSMLALLAYFFLKKKIDAPLLFLGEAISIFLAWCPTTILYNYLTYLFMTLGLISMYYGLWKKKKGLLILAGVFLGLNLFVRFPNITEVAFILAVWAYGFFKKKPFVKIYQDTLYCLIGYLISVISMFVLISVFFGADRYIQAITNLFAMNSEAVSYTPTAMVMSLVLSYIEGGKWLLYLLAAAVLGILLLLVTPNAVRKVMSVFYGIALLLYFRYLYQQGMFDLNYHYYLSVYQLTVIFLIISIGLILWELIRKKNSPEDKLYAMILLLLIGITPLGSNNHLYPNLNYLFLVAPFTLSKLFQFVKPIFQKREVQVFDGARILTLVFLAVFVIQTTLFGCFFVFNQGYLGEKRDAKVENSVIMNGMTTTKDKAVSLQELQDYLEKEGLLGQPVLLHGNIPGISYVFSMPSVISNPWSDLDSFPSQLFQEEMAKIDTPVLMILSKELGDWMLNRKLEDESNNQIFESNRKKITLKEFILERNYVPVFENAEFMVLQEEPTQ